MKVAALCALALCASFGPRPALAQDDASTETPRLTLGAGFAGTFGAFVDIDGQGVTTEQPEKTFWPELIVRADMPVSELLLLGVQTTFMRWQTTANEYFGTSHYMFDVGALVRVRFRNAAETPEHELLLSIPVGPTFEFFDLGWRNHGTTVDNEVGWHAGLIFSYQYVPPRSLLGYFGELGFTYHSVPKTFHHDTSREDVLYDVKELFIRGGFMLLPLH